jgi:hypothetical protein
MQVFVYQSETYRDVFGFTPDSAGANLPADFGPWKPVGNTAMRTGEVLVGVAGGSDVVMDGIAQEGFYLGRTPISISFLPGAS